MINRKFFFDQCRSRLFGGKLSSSQVEGLNCILDYWESELWDRDDRWLAYALATAYHETDQTMQPIREYGRGKGKKYGVMDQDTGVVYYGRGLVQLTWKYNYEKVDKAFNLSCVENPDLVMTPQNAVKIMFFGMETGLFTGKKFADYFNDKTEDWKKARRIINGMDKASIIAGHALKFYSAISYT